LRLCAVFGVAAVLLDRRCCDPFSRRVLRVSMGNVFNLPIRECTDLPADLQRLRRDEQFQLAAAVTDRQAAPLDEVHCPKRLVLLFGNESEGLDQSLIDACDLRITVPMPGVADSLNVAVAAGIILFHLSRRPAAGE
jgi:tRNA G18 (ribose-2'-O)-methylase SpoU